MRSSCLFSILSSTAIVAFAGALGACKSDDATGATRDAAASDATGRTEASDLSDGTTGEAGNVADDGEASSVGEADADAAIVADGGEADADAAALADGGDAANPDGSTNDAEAGPPAVAISYSASLKGNEELPPVGTAATGVATLTLSADRSTLAYHVTHDISGATAAHINLAAGGESGPIIFDLAVSGATFDGTASLAGGTDAGPGLTPKQIVDDFEMGAFYVSIDSAAHPTGELRGQILHPGETLYVATLTGSQQVPPVNSAGTGDCAVIVNTANHDLTYHLNTSLSATSADVRNGIGSIAGPMVFSLGMQPLSAGSVNGSQSLSTADGGTIDPTEIAAGHFYVSVHTAANPNGEIRGQMLLPGQVLYTAAMSPANEVPAVTSVATGGAQFILGVDGTSLSYEMVLTGFTATQADIHSGTNGVSGPIVYPLVLALPGSKGTLATTAADIANLNGSGYYCDAYSAAFPTGEIRGQIVKP